MKVKNTRAENKNGFTILEVMVSLAIVGISIGIFFSLIGNSSRLREKIDRHTELLLLARTKTEEALLGILGEKKIKENEGNIFEGITKDGLPWRVSEVDKYKEAKDKISLNMNHVDEDLVELPPKGTMLLSTLVGGISIETIFFSEESEESEGEDNEEAGTTSD